MTAPTFIPLGKSDTTEIELLKRQLETMRRLCAEKDTYADFLRKKLEASREEILEEIGQPLKRMKRMLDETRAYLLSDTLADKIRKKYTKEPLHWKPMLQFIHDELNKL